METLPCACSTNTMLSMYIANNTSSICFFAKFTDKRALFLERNIQVNKEKKKSQLKSI